MSYIVKATRDGVWHVNHQRREVKQGDEVQFRQKIDADFHVKAGRARYVDLNTTVDAGEPEELENKVEDPGELETGEPLETSTEPKPRRKKGGKQ
jgi:hypothetical protein